MTIDTHCSYGKLQKLCMPRRLRLLITSRFDWGLEAPVAVDLLSDEQATELFRKFAEVDEAEGLPEV